MSNLQDAPTGTLVRFTTGGWTLAAIALIGFNLRPAVSGLGPIIGQISQSLDVSSAVAGILTTAPVICFGIVGPFGPGIAHRFGLERVILVSMVLLAVATGLRSLGGETGLLLGMVLAGLSIGTVNVLLPSLVKQDFPRRIGAAMGLYTSALCIGAAAAPVLTPPFERAVAGGWRVGLAVWALPAAIGALAWLPQLMRRRATSRRHSGLRHGLWRSALAWQVTFNLTSLSALTYAMFVWGPKLLQDRGMSIDGSAEMIALGIAIQSVSGFLMPIWAARRRDQRLPAVIAAILTLAGLLGFVYAPLPVMPLVALCAGIGQGGAFGIGLALIALRAGNAESAAQLSGMSQTVCYIIGGLMGPFAVGIIHQWTGGWTGVAILFTLISIVSVFTALGAGRAGTVEANGRRTPVAAAD
jgi:CP family cyanate transporter-like MFS transporter